MTSPSPNTDVRLLDELMYADVVQPATAAKPAHLTTNSTLQSQAHLAALRGATTAFASSPVSISPPSKTFRRVYDGLPNQDEQDIVRGRSLEESWTSNTAEGRPRSRGRHLSPEDAQAVDARRAAVTASSSPRPRPPLTLDRSQSMIAARLVSASPSPVRSNPSASPPSETVTPTERDMYRKEAAPQKSISLVMNSQSQPTQQNKGYFALRATPAPAIDFDTLPKLAPVPSVALSSGLPVHEKEKDNIASTSTEPNGSQMKVATLRHKTATSPSAYTSSNGFLSPQSQVSSSAKPAVPAPRRGRTPVPSALKQNLTGPRPGETREEAINRMADAMVASSLASSRPPSPAKPYKGHSLIRRSASTHDLYKLQVADPTPPPVPTKPVRPMKQTLRKHSSDNEDDGKDASKRGRRHLVRKHPNKHNEGDRKRWRDKVTELERKRYEGVFAANRGLLLKPSNPRASPSRMLDPNAENNLVVNVVVRDIWERSRLPLHILQQIYDLVAPEQPLYLNREQFVVGMWLIDQKLKGRKLPVQVSPSVWASVRHLHGINLGRSLD